MSEKYKWIAEEDYFDEVEKLDKLLEDFCIASSLYEYENVKVNLSSLRDIIVRVHKRKHYFKVFHDMVTSEYKETALYCYWILKLRLINLAGNALFRSFVIVKII